MSLLPYDNKQLHVCNLLLKARRNTKWSFASKKLVFKILISGNRKISIDQEQGKCLLYFSNLF